MHSQIEFSKNKTKIISVLLSISISENCIYSASFCRYLLMHREKTKKVWLYALNEIFDVLLIDTSGLQCRYLDKMSIFSLISNFQSWWRHLSSNKDDRIERSEPYYRLTYECGPHKNLQLSKKEHVTIGTIGWIKRCLCK